jgi:hypothetical protein
MIFSSREMPGRHAMPKNPKQTGPKAATAASKTMQNPKATKTEKTAAASALAQTPLKKKK